MALAAQPLSPTPGVDAGLFREALGRFATGVALITADVGGTPHGLVVNSLASVSLRPPLLSFCPSRDSLTWSRMRRSRRFGVNVLGARHDGYVRRAAPAAADRFAGIDWRPTPSGVPRLTGAIAFLECTIEAEHAAGDHWIVVGRVEHANVDRRGRPLVFWGSGFARLTPQAT